MKSKKKIVVITKQPMNLINKNGSSYYTYAIYKELNKYYDTYLIYASCKKVIFEKIDSPIQKTSILGGFIFRSLSINIINIYNAILNYISFIYDVRKYSVQELNMNDVFDNFRINILLNKIKSINPDIVLCNYVFTSNIIQYLPNHINTFIITHDIIHKRREILNDHKESHNIEYWTQDNEISLLEKSKNLLAIQKEEEQYLKKICPGQNIITLYPPIHCTYGRKANTHHLLFVATNNFFNQTGISWFIHKIFPSCCALGIKLIVCGRICNFLKKNGLHTNRNIILRGKVENIDKEYLRAGAVIIPLLYGTGLKMKLVEALSYGCPVITTSVGAEGLSGIDGYAGIIADDPNSFFNGIVEVLYTEDKNRAYSRRAYNYSKTVFNPLASTKQFHNLLQSKMENIK